MMDIRRTPRPRFNEYAFAGLDWNNPDRDMFAADYYREGREVALAAIVTHSALEAVGLTGGFVSESLS